MIGEQGNELITLGSALYVEISLPIYLQPVVLKVNKGIPSCGHPQMVCQSDMVPVFLQLAVMWLGVVMTDKAWRTYEEVATYLLDINAKEFGLNRVEAKQSLSGKRSGTSWVVDAKGINENGTGIVIVECRRYTMSRQNQEKMGALAYRIIDTGASGGIIVSPMGLQPGAEKVASSEGILEVMLDADSTPQEFAMRFLNKLMVGIQETISVSDSYTATALRVCEQCGEQFEVKEDEKVCPKCGPKEIR